VDARRGPVALFEQSVAWLRRHRVLLPGVTVLERLVGSVRERADVRMYAVVAKQVRRADAGLPAALSGLLVVPPGSRISELEKLRQAPKRTSGTEMVRALQRVDNLAGFGLGRVAVSKVPVRRMKTLAKYGAGSKAPALDRLVEPRRTATLLAVTRSLEAEAIDDALDLFALLMATRLISPARRKSADERLRMLPRLERASKLVAKAGRVLIDQLDLVDQEGADLDVAAMWAAVAEIAGASKEQVRAALEVVEELVPEEDGAAEAAMRAALVEKYNTVRPFLRLLGESKALSAAPGGRRVLAAVRRLPELSRRQVSKKPLLPKEIDAVLVTASWKRAVYANPDLPQGAVDRDAYVVCVLEHLMRALTIRDVFASPSLRWADPRAHLLAGAQWEAIAEDVLASLSLTDPVEQHLNDMVLALDAAWKQMAARLEEAGEDALVSVVTPAEGGGARLSVEKLGALGESESLAWLRAACQAMLPRIDLPELLLEVHAWTGFLDVYVHLADISTRMNDLPRSLVALLVSEACNVGLTPVSKAGDEALTRGRLSHVDQNYVRGETHAAANAILIEHQGKVPIVAAWGGGLLASVDGLRFVVPVKTINAGPSPKYYGYKRGITWLNAVNDQVAGIGQMVVPGTPRDSLYILDCLINLDAGPKPEVVTTDQASDSDMVFGIFSMLGYRFAPRFADLGDQRFWRADLPNGSTGDYGVLEVIARNKVNTKKVLTQWPDMLRVAGSLVTNQVRAYDLLRRFARQGHPAPLGQAFAEYRRIDKTMHLLSMLGPIDSSYRRSLGKQLSVQESRHRLARKICHGNAGKIRQAYREGQEDQLAVLGLVLNAVVLWNSTYLSAIVDQLRAQGVPVKDEDLARLSPLGHAHLNCLGRYAIASSAPDKGLRPLGAAALPEVSAASTTVVADDGV
ncbi:Tn3 family transposase, partial [Nonomuraea sp. RK-328]|nr:Tn3 family transposase [Nonomuraea sp. RK-328]